MPQTYTTINGQNYDTSILSMPNDRTFRSAWYVEDSIVKVDMKKAREIHRQNLRQQRQPFFAQHDDVIRVLDRKRVISGSLKAAEKQKYTAAEAECQKLRDIPDHSAIELAETPEQLQQLTIELLLEQS